MRCSELPPAIGGTPTPGAKGNIRDEANGAQLVCLSNMESLNAEFINQGINQGERLHKLNAMAIEQMKVLVTEAAIKRLAERHIDSLVALRTRPGR